MMSIGSISQNIQILLLFELIHIIENRDINTAAIVNTRRSMNRCSLLTEQTPRDQYEIVKTALLWPCYPSIEYYRQYDNPMLIVYEYNNKLVAIIFTIIIASAYSPIALFQLKYLLDYQRLLISFVNLIHQQSTTSLFIMSRNKENLMLLLIGWLNYIYFVFLGNNRQNKALKFIKDMLRTIFPPQEKSKAWAHLFSSLFLDWYQILTINKKTSCKKLVLTLNIFIQAYHQLVVQQQLLNKMSINQNLAGSDLEQKRVYGFMDQTTNTFYAFDSYQQYHCFLEWLEQQQTLSQTVSPSLEIPNDEFLLEEQRRATEDIMNIFTQPCFQYQNTVQDSQMMEIDF